MKRSQLIGLIKRKLKNVLSSLREPADSAQPVYPRENSNELRLHLGAGNINLQGWVNIDARAGKHIHLCRDNFSLEEFVDNSIGEIYLCHVLEHLAFDELNAILINFRNKLRNGGRLRISVPDFNSLVRIYLDRERDLESIRLALMGGQDYAYNHHKSVFDYRLLSKYLTDAGFTNIESWNTVSVFGRSIGDWSDKRVCINGRDYIDISLNLECIKPHE
jgi:predicted SAM-dependent methyltransferase